MVSLVKVDHHICFIVACVTTLIVSSNLVPTVTATNTTTTSTSTTTTKEKIQLNNVSSHHQLQPEESQVEKSILATTTVDHQQQQQQPTSTDETTIKVESQIERQPVTLTASASEYEPASVSSYHNSDGSSDGYNSHSEHKLSDQGSQHESGKGHSHGKEWDKLKEKERRVKDRGTGFIKAFTWDREEVSKDKYKDKGAEHSSDTDHAKGSQYKHQRHNGQHKSSHRKNSKSNSGQSNGNSKGSNNANDDTNGYINTPPQDGQVLAYDPNILLYANALNQLPSSDEVYVQPNSPYTMGGNYYLQPMLY